MTDPFGLTVKHLFQHFRKQDKYNFIYKKYFNSQKNNIASPNIPAKDFWSFTSYENETRSMLQTDQQFPAIGSENKGLVKNADGSVDVYFGPKLPPEKKATGYKPFRVKDGIQYRDCMVRWIPGSTKPGSRENLC